MTLITCRPIDHSSLLQPTSHPTQASHFRKCQRNPSPTTSAVWKTLALSSPPSEVLASVRRLEEMISHPMLRYAAIVHLLPTSMGDDYNNHNDDDTNDDDDNDYANERKQRANSSPMPSLIATRRLKLPRRWMISVSSTLNSPRPLRPRSRAGTARRLPSWVSSPRS